MTHIDGIHLSEDGKSLWVSHLTVCLTADSTEMDRRIVALFREVIAEWRAQLDEQK